MNAYSSTPSRERLAVVLACLALGSADAVGQVSWAFAPGAFTHDPRTGVRVAQYAQHEPVEGLPDPRQTVSRYWRTQTNLRGVDGSADTIYEVRSFGNTLGGFDAQRERGFDAQLETLDALTPFRFNPYLFFGGLQGFGYGAPGYPAPVPGLPVPGPQGVAPYGYAPQGYSPQGYAPQGYAPQGYAPQGYAPQGYAPQGYVPQGYVPQGAWQPPLALPGCEGGNCGTPASGATPLPAAGTPGTAWPYAPPTGFVAPPFYGYLPPWWGYGPGRGGYFGGGYPGGVPAHP